MRVYRIDVGEAFFLEMSQRIKKSPGEIVMVIRRPDDRFLLMTKDFYPDDVYRLPTGKMKIGELPEDCFAREVAEETGFITNNFLFLATLHYEIAFGGSSIDYPSHVFATETISGEPSPADLDEGISSFREVTNGELLNTADELERLGVPWEDWGRWRAVAHRVVHVLTLTI